MRLIFSIFCWFTFSLTFESTKLLDSEAYECFNFKFRCTHSVNEVKVGENENNIGQVFRVLMLKVGNFFPNSVNTILGLSFCILHIFSGCFLFRIKNLTGNLF